MLKGRNLLLVIADGAQVRFVRPAEDDALRTMGDAESRPARKRSVELGADSPGASFHSGSSAHHAMAPRHDPQALEKEKFAHFVASRLNAAAASGGFDELVLI